MSRKYEITFWAAVSALFFVSGIGCSGSSSDDDDATLTGDDDVSQGDDDTGPGGDDDASQSGDDDSTVTHTPTPTPTPKPDEELPVITFNLAADVTNGGVGADITVHCTITDNTGVGTAYVYYAASGGSTFGKVSMVAGRKGAYDATIPGSAVTGDMDFYLQATDSSSNKNVASLPADAPKSVYTVFTGPALDLGSYPSQVQIGQTIQFVPAGGDGNYTYSLPVNGSGGLISASGLYQAGPNPDTTDQVQVKDSSGASGAANISVVACTHGSGDVLIRDNLVGTYVVPSAKGSILAAPFEVYQGSFTVSELSAYFGKVSITDGPANYILHLYRNGANQPGTEIVASDSVKVTNTSEPTVFTWPKKTVLPTFRFGDVFWAGLEYVDEASSGKITPMTDDGTLASRADSLIKTGSTWYRMGLSPMIRVKGCAVQSGDYACDGEPLALITTDPAYLPVFYPSAVDQYEIADFFTVNQSDFVLSAVTAQFYAKKAADATGTFIAEVYSDGGGKPGSLISASAPETVTEISPAFHTFTLDPPVTRMYPGQVFWVSMVYVKPNGLYGLVTDDTGDLIHDTRTYSQANAQTQQPGTPWATLGKSTSIQAVGCSQELASAGDLYALTLTLGDDSCGTGKNGAATWALDTSSGTLRSFNSFALRPLGAGFFQDSEFTFSGPYFQVETTDESGAVAGVVSFHYEGEATVSGGSWDGALRYVIDASTDPAYTACEINYAVSGALQ